MPTFKFAVVWCIMEEHKEEGRDDRGSPIETAACAHAVFDSLLHANGVDTPRLGR